MLRLTGLQWCDWFYISGQRLTEVGRVPGWTTSHPPVLRVATDSCELPDANSLPVIWAKTLPRTPSGIAGLSGSSGAAPSQMSIIDFDDAVSASSGTYEEQTKGAACDPVASDKHTITLPHRQRRHIM